MAPAYDMNPVPAASGLSLNISEADNAQSLDLVRKVAPYFRVKPGKASEMIDEVAAQVRGWRKIARSLQIPPEESDRMAPAFRIAEKI